MLDMKNRGNLGDFVEDEFEGVFATLRRLSRTVATLEETIATLEASTIVQSTSGVLTNAQIMALPTIPHVLRAAAGPGLRIKPIGITYFVNTVAAGYTNIDPTYAALQVTTENGYWQLMAIVNDATYTTVPFNDLDDLLGVQHFKVLDVGLYTSGIAGVTGDGEREYNTVISTGGQPSTSDVDNSAIILSIDNNGAGDLTGGNAANSLPYRFYFIEEAMP